MHEDSDSEFEHDDVIERPKDSESDSESESGSGSDGWLVDDDEEEDHEENESTVDPDNKDSSADKKVSESKNKDDVVVVVDMEDANSNDIINDNAEEEDSSASEGMEVDDNESSANESDANDDEDDEDDVDDDDDDENEDGDEEEEEEEEEENNEKDINSDDKVKKPYRGRPKRVRSHLLAPKVDMSDIAVTNLANCAYRGILEAKKKGEIIQEARESYVKMEPEKRFTLKEANIQLAYMSDFTKKKNDTERRWWLKEEFANLVEKELRKSVDEKMDDYIRELLKAKRAAKRAKSKSKRKSDSDSETGCKKARKDSDSAGTTAAAAAKPPPPADLTEDDDPRIGTHKGHFESWLADARKIIGESCVTDEEMPQKLPLDKTPEDFTDDATQKLLACMIQGRCETLELLAEHIAKQLCTENSTDLQDRILLLAERKAHGVKDQRAIAKSDSNPDALWRWEVVNQALLPEDCQKTLTDNRRRMFHFSRRIGAVSRLLKSLRKNHNEIKETRIAKDLELVEKYLREDEVARQRDAEKQERVAAREEEKKRKELEREQQKRVREEAKAQEKAKLERKKGVPLTNFFSVKAQSASTSSTNANGAASPAKKDVASEDDERARMAAKIDEALQRPEEALVLTDWVKRLVAKRPRATSPSPLPKELQNDPVAIAKQSRKKLLHFGENRRPPYFGTFRKRSAHVTARRPFAMDESLDYDIDSDLEWQEDPEDAESLGGSDAASENDKDLDYQDGWLMRDEDVVYASDAMDNDEYEDPATSGTHEKTQPARGARRYAVGIVYDRERIEAADDGTDPATNLSSYPVKALPLSHITTYEQAVAYLEEPLSLEPPNETEIAKEMLSKADLKLLKQNEKVAQKAAAQKAAAQKKIEQDEKKRQEQALLADGIVDITTSSTGSPKRSQATAPLASTPGSKKDGQTELFPEIFMSVLVTNVQGSDLMLKKLTQLVQEEIDKTLMKAYVENDFKGDKGKPPTQTCIKATIQEVAKKPKRASWQVEPDVLAKYAAK